MTKSLLDNDKAMAIIFDLFSFRKSAPEQGNAVRLPESVAGKLIQDLKDFDDFKATSLSRGAKKVVR